MTRQYKQAVRADKLADTRARILAAARELMENATDLEVEQVARRAAVSVPTLYSHFGSKGGLLSALTAQIETEAGLFAGFGLVWQCQDGESALRAMLNATFGFWEQAWIYIRFALRVRRTDEELGARIDRMDVSRHGHLVVICKRLRQEKRLRPGLTVESAARLAFTLSTPYIYESLVVQGGMDAAQARRLAVETAIGAVVAAGAQPARIAPADWGKLGLRPPIT